MRLVALSCHGFKSFATKVKLTFDGGVVGIVGPNGAGKSNISDAIKWVLGETSVKSLRGSSMEDVIFSGSTSVQAMDKASVSLTFDNSEKLLKNFGTKVKITRTIERKSRTSKYFVNDELATLKEIKMIAMETGISKTSLAVISQGTVSDIADDDPLKRRAIFDEAAGVLVYKKRKEEALKKLDATNENFQQISLLKNELQKQVTPLQKQAEKAKIFVEKSKVLQSVEISLIVLDVEFFEQKREKLSQKLQDFEEQKADLTDQIRSYNHKLEEIFQQKGNLEKDIQALSKDQEATSEKIRVLELEDLKTSQRRQMVLEGAIKTSSKEQEAVLQAEFSELKSKVDFYLASENSFEQKISEENSKVQNLRREMNNRQIDLNNLKSAVLRNNSKIQVLASYKDSKSHFFKGTQTITENAHLFAGVEGVVMNLFTVSPENQQAIESILKNALQNIVVQESKTAVQAIRFLKENKAGHATFIPLSSIKPRAIPEEHLRAIENLAGFVSVAKDLVSHGAKHEKLFQFLLGHIIIANTIEQANEIAEVLNHRYMVVSLDGNIVKPGGILSGGFKKTPPLLNIPNQIAEVKAQLPGLNQKVQETENQIIQLQSRILESENQIAQDQIEKTRFNEKKNNLEFRIADVKSQMNNLNISLPSSRDSLQSQSTSNLNKLEQEKSLLASTLNSKRETLNKLDHEILTVSTSKSELENHLLKTTEEFSSFLSDKKQADYILENAHNRLSTGYNLTFNKAKEMAKPLENVEEGRKQVEKIKQEIKKLGYVNIEAIEAFDKVNDRFEKISSTYEELFEAQQTILGAIKEMDQIIVQKLEQTVENVNSEIDPIFKSMFGGGYAEVKFSDDSDILTSGIDVVVQPPGKTVRNFKLFSGGEKSLVVICLLFAILKSKPLPLCVLDEVEAALDEANVVRYVKFLQELKTKTQFLVATHRVGTMARVDYLLGVTMQNKGVTSVFSIEMDKAKELISG